MVKNRLRESCAAARGPPSDGMFVTVLSGAIEMVPSSNSAHRMLTRKFCGTGTNQS